MRDNVLQQFTGRSVNSPFDAEREGDGAEDYGAFGWLRGIRDKALFLELRRRDGNISALPYFMLERVDFDPSEGITLRFTGQTVKVAGRNLNGEVWANIRLLNGLLRHKVPWIQEADEPSAMAADQRATIVEAIELK